jgi:ElaB/YqjD/DUF883 family membrane-anchored ribosome-binding protein
MSRSGLFPIHRRGAPIDDVQEDLRALRGHLAELADQVSDLLSAKSTETVGQIRKQMRRAGRMGSNTALEVAGRARDTAGAVHEAADEMFDQMGGVVQRHPMKVLAVSLGLVLLLAMAWRR